MFAATDGTQAEREISAVAAAGELSWEQLEAVCQVATPEMDSEWARRAPGWTPAQLNRHARAQRTVTSEQACVRDAERSFTWRWDQNRMLQFRGQLPDVAGAKLVAVLEDQAVEVTQDADGNSVPFPARCADAFMDLISQPLGDESEPERACVIAPARPAVCRARCAGRCSTGTGPTDFRVADAPERCTSIT